MSKIILIGGPQRCGKSTLAQAISKELNIPWVTTSTLEAVIRQYTLREQDNQLFPKSMLRKKEDGGNEAMYSKYSAEKIVESYLIQSDTASKGIQAFVKHINQQGWNYILEGYHITPELVEQIKKGGINVDSIILINTNPNELIRRSLSSKTEHDWVRDEIRSEENYIKIGEMITLYSNKLMEEAKRYGVRVVDIGQDFQKSFNEVFESFK
jgi:2-phosphoglycerate kinase